MASRSLGSLTLDLIARTSGFVSGMDAAERKALEANKKIQRETQKTIDTIDRWGTAAATAATAAGAAIAYATAKAVEHVAAQNDLAQTLGTTQAELVSLQRAADLSGVSSDELAVAMKRLNNTIGEAQGGSKSAAEALGRLGLTAEQLTALPMAERFAAISTAVSGLGTQTERAASAQDLFGKSGQALLPMLQDNGETLALAAQQTEAWGLALSALDVSKIAEADDAVSNVRAVFTGLQNQLAAAFAPAITEASNRLVGLAENGRGFGDAAFEAFRVAAMGAGYLADLIAALNGVIKIAEVGTNSIALAFNLVAMSIDQVALSIDRVLGTDTVENLKRRQEVITGTVSAGMARLSTSWQDMSETLGEPLPHYAVEKFFADVRKRSKETAAGVRQDFTGDGPLPAPTAKPATGKATEGIDTYLAKQLAIEEEYAQKSREAKQAEADFNSELLRLRFRDEALYREEDLAAEEEAQARKVKMQREGADAIGRLLEQAGTKSRTLAKAALVWQKATALAQIAMDTPKAAMAAASAVAGIPVVGPALAATAAAAMYALGAAAAGAVISGGGGGGGGSAPPTAGVSPTTATGVQPAPAPAQRATVFDIRLVGAGSRPSWEEVRQMMEEIGERMADSGGRIGKVTVLTA